MNRPPRPVPPAHAHGAGVGAPLPGEEISPWRLPQLFLGTTRLARGSVKTRHSRPRAPLRLGGMVNYRAANVTMGERVTPCSGVTAAFRVHCPSNRINTRNERSRWSQRGASLVSNATSARSPSA